VHAQILDQHGLHQIIGRTVPLGGRLVDQSLGLWVLLPLGLAQAIEKDRSQVFFLGGVVKGLSTREAGVPERKLDGRCRHLSGCYNARSSRGGSAEFALLHSVPAPGTSHGRCDCSSEVITGLS